MDTRGDAHVIQQTNDDPIDINLRMYRMNHIFTVKPNITVERFKTEIAKVLNIDVIDQYLFYKKQRLRTYMTLSDYHIREGSVVILEYRCFILPVYWKRGAPPLKIRVEKKIPMKLIQLDIYAEIGMHPDEQQWCLSNRLTVSPRPIRLLPPPKRHTIECLGIMPGDCLFYYINKDAIYAMLNDLGL